MELHFEEWKILFKILDYKSINSNEIITVIYILFHNKFPQKKVV